MGFSTLKPPQNFPLPLSFSLHLCYDIDQNNRTLTADSREDRRRRCTGKRAIQTAILLAHRRPRPQPHTESAYKEVTPNAAGGSPETVQKQLYRYLLAKREVPMGVREMLPGSLEAGGSQHPLPGHAYRLFRTD